MPVTSEKRWLIDRWVATIKAHSRPYDPVTLLDDVKRSVQCLTDSEVADYVKVLKANDERISQCD